MVEIFDPRKLEVGDVIWIRGGTLGIPSMEFPRNCSSMTEVDRVVTGITDSVVETWPAQPFLKTALVGNILKVKRAGDTIFPKPQPNFRVGDFVQFSGEFVSPLAIGQVVNVRYGGTSVDCMGGIAGTVRVERLKPYVPPVEKVVVILRSQAQYAASCEIARTICDKFIVIPKESGK